MEKSWSSDRAPITIRFPPNGSQFIKTSSNYAIIFCRGRYLQPTRIESRAFCSTPFLLRTAHAYIITLLKNVDVIFRACKLVAWVRKDTFTVYFPSIFGRSPHSTGTWACSFFKTRRTFPKDRIFYQKLIRLSAHASS